MNVKSKKLQGVLLDVGILILGGFLFAVAYNMFLLPGEIFVGGAGGIAEVLNLLFGLPTGLMIIAINIPLALLFCIFYGYRSGIKSFIGITVTSLSIDFIKFLPEAFPQPKENAFLCAIFGGISLGAAIGIMLYRGFTTGGSDFVALLIKLKAKKISTAKLIAIVDAIVIIGAAIVMKNFLSVFYSLVSVLVSVLFSAFAVSPMPILENNPLGKFSSIAIVTASNNAIGFLSFVVIKIPPLNLNVYI